MERNRIITSQNGIETLGNFFESLSVPELHEGDGASTKDVAGMNIKTYTASSDGYVELKKVLSAHKVPFKGRVYQVHTSQGTITLTPSDQVFVVTSSRGKEISITKKEAGELNPDDYILMPRGQSDIGDYVRLPFHTFYQCVHCGRKANGGKRKQCKGCNKLHWHKGPTTTWIELNEEVAYFTSLVLSDGHMMKNDYTIEFCGNDRKLIDVFSKLSFDLFGLETHEYEENRSEMYRVRINSKLVCLLLEQIGVPRGKKSKTIRIPQVIGKSPISVIAAFMAGLIDGDGNLSEKRWRIATGSYEFAEGLQTLMRFLGLTCSFSVNKPSKTGVKNGGASYAIRISNWPLIPPLLNGTRFKDKPINKFARVRYRARILSVTEEPYNGPLYYLSIEGDSPYVINGILVSGTQGQVPCPISELGA